MAEKKAKPKTKAKPEIKAEPDTKSDFELAMETDELAKLARQSNDHDDFIQGINMPTAVPMSLQYSASDLAAMARAAKAGKADMQDVIAEHDLYLSLVKLGAQAPAADVEFVKNHMKYLKTL